MADHRTQSSVAFIPKTPIAEADSIDIIEIAISIPQVLDLNWDAISNFSQTLAEVERQVWAESSEGFCKSKKLNGMLEHSQDLLIDNIKRQTLDLNRERATLISDVKAFVNSTHESNRRSVTLFAMGAAAALVLEPMVKKTACKVLDLNWDAIRNFSQTLAEMERQVWAESSKISQRIKLIKSLTCFTSNSNVKLFYSLKIQNRKTLLFIVN